MADARDKLVRHPGPGCVVEFMQGDRPQLAWVLEEKGGKLRLVTATKRETKLAAVRLLPWSGPARAPDASREDILAHLARHEEARSQTAADTDALELWEMAQGELPEARAEWFAELAYEDPDTDRIAGVGRALLECKTHFKFRPPVFEIRPAEAVEARLAEAEAARLRERLMDAGQLFFKQLWDVHLGRAETPEPPDDPTVSAALKDLLLARIADPEGSEDKALWDGVRKGLGLGGRSDDPFLPLYLAEAWGLTPPHHNFHLDRAGYEPGDAWSQAHTQAVHDLAAAVDALADMTETTPYVSVDSATTLDVDDAFFVEPLAGQGGWRLCLALAGPARLWPFGSDLDRAVMLRATSIYLPEGDHHMMPEALGTDAFSLLEGQARPALVLEAEIGPDGNLKALAPRCSRVLVARRATFDQVEDLLEGRGDTLPGHQDNVRHAYALAEALLDRRIRQGAVVIDRPEPDIQVRREEDRVLVSAGLKDPCPLAQRLVGELMIFANSALAQWAAERNVPLLYRTQDLNLPEGSAGVWSAPEEIFSVVKTLGPSILETQPKRHASLAAPAYAPVTSPLRRYPDLLNSAQVLSFLEHGAPRLGREDLEALLPLLAARLDAAGQVQRFRPRYWKLVYCKQHPKTEHAAVIVDDGNLVTAALPHLQLFVRAPRAKFGDKVYPGQRYLLRLGKIDPLNNEIHVTDAMED